MWVGAFLRTEPLETVSALEVVYELLRELYTFERASETVTDKCKRTCDDGSGVPWAELQGQIKFKEESFHIALKMVQNHPNELQDAHDV